MRLGDILLKRGLVTPDQLEAALAVQQSQSVHRWLGQILLDQKILAESDLAKALAEQAGLGHCTDLAEVELDPNLVRDIPLDWIRSRKLLPVRHEGRLSLLVASPSCLDDVDDVALMLGEMPTVVLAPASLIVQAIEQCYFSKADSARTFIDTISAPSQPGSREGRESDDLLRSAEQAPVAQLVNLILLEAVKAGASDVHIEPYADELRVRYRIDGILADQASPPRHMEAGLVSRLKVMAHLDIAERRLPQDGSARVRVGDRDIDIRVSTVPVAEGERVVLRLLHRQSAMLPLEDLGMSGDTLERFRRCLNAPHGVIWVTGPTGSGKTTTLYTALGELDTKRMNVLTIEDPIEYQLPGIGQIAVKPKIGLTFARGLRHVLRQDPDVILVGETRDLETAEIVVRASLTGHLVFSTLHTNDACGAVARLVDMGIEPYLVASATRASMAQRLVRRLVSEHSREAQPTDDQRRLLAEFTGHLQGATFRAPKPGVAEADAYRGRLGVYELLIVRDAVAEAVRHGASLAELRRLAREQGMHTLIEDGLDKAACGLTTLDEVLRVMGGE